MCHYVGLMPIVFTEDHALPAPTESYLAAFTFIIYFADLLIIAIQMNEHLDFYVTKPTINTAK